MALKTDKKELKFAWKTFLRIQSSLLSSLNSTKSWLNPSDAKRLGIRNHDFITVESRRGRIDKIRARVTSIVGPGQVFVPFHFVEASANNLTLDDACPHSREPNFKQCAVRIETL